MSRGRLAGVTEGLAGEAGVAIGAPGGDPALAGELQSGSAWSTIKVAIALRVIDEAGGLGALTGGQRDLIERALTASDNDAAAALFDQLGAGGGVEAAAAAVTDVLREAGDAETVVSTQGRDGFSSYGQTDWSLAAQHRFVSALVAGCLAEPAATEHVLELMGRVTSDTWGLGSAGLPARWKGGWGPDPDGAYLVRQMGVLETERGEAVVALAARADDGSFESAQAIATELATRLAELAPEFAGRTSYRSCR